MSTHPAATLVNHYEFKQRFERVFTILEALEMASNRFTKERNVQILPITQASAHLSAKMLSAMAQYYKDSAELSEVLAPYTERFTPSYVIAALGFKNLSLFSSDDPLFDLSTQHILKELSSTDVRNISSRQAITMHWLVTESTMHLYDLLVLLFLFRHYGFEDEHDLYRSRVAQLRTVLAQGQGVENATDIGDLIPEFHNFEELLAHMQEPYMQIDVSTGQWRQFFGSILAQV